jgi:hypothetical protein
VKTDTVYTEQVGSGSKAYDWYSENPCFYTRSEYRLFLLRFFVIFLISSRRMSGERLQIIHTRFLLHLFQSFINHFNIRHTCSELRRTSLNKPQTNAYAPCRNSAEVLIICFISFCTINYPAFPHIIFLTYMLTVAALRRTYNLISHE